MCFRIINYLKTMGNFYCKRFLDFSWFWLCRLSVKSIDTYLTILDLLRCSLPHPTRRTIPSQSNPLFAPQCYKKTVLHPSEMPFLMENITNLQQYIIVEQIQWSIYQQINIKMLPIYFKDSSYTYQNIDKYFFQRSSSLSSLTFQRYIFSYTSSRLYPCE